MTSFIPMNNVQFDKRLEDVQQCSDKVILTFADGKTADASILVGSDGIQSTVRAHILRHLYPDQVEPVYADSYCYRGVIPIAEAQEILGSHTDTAKFYFGDRRSCVAYRISEGRVSLRIPQLVPDGVECADIYPLAGVQLPSMRRRCQQAMASGPYGDRKGHSRADDGRLPGPRDRRTLSSPPQQGEPDKVGILSSLAYADILPWARRARR